MIVSISFCATESVSSIRIVSRSLVRSLEKREFLFSASMPRLLRVSSAGLLGATLNSLLLRYSSE